MHQENGVYLHERDLAKALLPPAARHGRLDLVQALDGINPEVLQEHSDIMKLAAQYGHLQVVQYAYSRLLPMLPQQVLEAAMLHGHEGVARWLYERYPQAVGWRAALGLARGGHIELLQRLESNDHIQYTDVLFAGADEWCGTACSVAGVSEDAWLLGFFKRFAHHPSFAIIDAVARDASCVCMPTLQHIIRNESPTPNSKVFCAAASAERTDIVDWMLAECPQWTSAEAIKYAAGAGHQELAQRLSDHFGVPLSECHLQPHHLQALIGSGHLQKLEWIEKHCQLSCDQELLLFGIKSRNLAVAQLLRRHCPDVEFTEVMLIEACCTGNLRLVQWVYQHLPATVRPADAIDQTARRGFEQIIAWLHEHTNLPCTAEAMNSAARIGRLDLVRFLHEHRKEGRTHEAMVEAIWEDHVDVADYLRSISDRDCQRNTLWEAIRGRSTLASIKWIVTHFPQLLTEEALHWVAEYSRFDVVEFFHSLPNAPFSAATMDSAALSGNLDLVRWFHENRSEGCTPDGMAVAALNGDLSIAKFLHEHGYPMCGQDDIENSPEFIKDWWRSIKPPDSSSPQET
ncbi:hypothetical protein RI367_007259 [Sorochytrium milnesiophthora]